ncbi:MAG: protein arginine kinase [Defluviitaleaceae bacterium]|nr:protein arginine kinase [Defluviitaleaceae bacterium]
MPTPWYQESITDESEILSSRVRLARNIKKYPFRKTITPVGALTMVTEATQAIESAGENRFFLKIDMNTLNQTEQAVFQEKHIVSPEFISGKLPKGLMLSRDENISVMLNEEDHVRIQAIKPGEGLSLAYETAGQIDDLLEEHLEFAFSAEYGYLTACPTNTGTGLRASYMLHLPCLSKTVDLSKTVLPQLTKVGVTLRGIHGEGTSSMGNIFQISNQNTLGKSETDIILGLQNVTHTVIQKEQQARENILSTNRSQIEDIVYRAYGILTNSRMISASEALDLLSDIRLGYITGLLAQPKPAKQIYQIMMEIQPGHLQRTAGTEMSEQERDIKRSEYLRQIFM